MAVGFARTGTIVLGLLIPAALAVTFGTSSIAKALYPASALLFIRTITGLDPASSLALVACICVVEALLFGALVSPSLRRIGVAVAGVLLIAASTVLAVAAVRGLAADCGCFGPPGSSGGVRGALARNGALLVCVAVYWCLPDRAVHVRFRREALQ